MIKLTPEQWEKETGIEIIDPDGWDRADFQNDWAKPISLDEFIEKAQQSTTHGSWPQYAMHVWKQSILTKLEKNETSDCI